MGPDELRMFSARVEDDLVRGETEVGIGAIPWENLDRAREMAKARGGAVERTAGGDGLPAVVITAKPKEARRIAEQLAAEGVEGVMVTRAVEGPFLAVVTRAQRVHALYAAHSPKDHEAVRLFERRRGTVDGAHAIVVLAGEDETVHGLFEAVLRQERMA